MKTYNLNIMCNTEEANVLYKLSNIFSYILDNQCDNVTNTAISMLTEVDTPLLPPSKKEFPITLECDTEQVAIMNLIFQDYSKLISQSPDLEGYAADMAIVLESVRYKILREYKRQTDADPDDEY